MLFWMQGGPWGWFASHVLGYVISTGRRGVCPQVCCESAAGSGSVTRVSDPLKPLFKYSEGLCIWLRSSATVL